MFISWSTAPPDCCTDVNSAFVTPTLRSLIRVSYFSRICLHCHVTPTSKNHVTCIHSLMICQFKADIGLNSLAWLYQEWSNLELLMLKSNAVEGQLPYDTIGASPCVLGILKPLYDTLGTDNSSYDSSKDNLRVLNLRTFA